MGYNHFLRNRTVATESNYPQPNRRLLSTLAKSSFYPLSTFYNRHKNVALKLLLEFLQERERRRQHILMAKALDARKKLEVWLSLHMTCSVHGTLVLEYFRLKHFASLEIWLEGWVLILELGKNLRLDYLYIQLLDSKDVFSRND